MPTYFLYARKSSEAEDRQILSIDSQMKELQAVAGKLNLSIADVLTEAQSAKAPGRPVFNAMMQRIYRGEAQGILCWKLDRLARNPVDGGSIIWALKQRGIKILTPTQSYSHEEENTILMYIEFGMAQKYIDDLSRNVKRGLKTKVEQGWLPGLAPLGYLNEKDGQKGYKTIVKDPQRFPLVRKMWEVMLTGSYRVSEIWRMANNDWGFRTRPSKKEGSKPLSLSGLYRILTNPFYGGEFEYPEGSGIWHKGAHEPMISREEYQRVQELLGRPGKPRPQLHTFAFTGLIRCGECGAMVTAEEKWKRQKNGNAHHYIYYHCTKRKDPHCSQRYIEEHELEAQIAEYLARMQISERFKDWAITYLRKLHDHEVTDRSSIYHNLQKTYNTTQQAIDELIRMRYQGLVDNDEYEKERSRLKLELANLKEKLNDTEHRADKWLELSEKTFEFACYARTIFQEGDLHTKKQILEAIGSNLLLKDKTLNIQAQKPFLLIEHVVQGVKAESRRFEPLKMPMNKEKSRAFGSAHPIWLPG